MNQADKNNMVERYRKRFQEHNGSVKILGAGSEEHRRIRFNVIKEVGDLNNCSVLDFGCGLSDFYAFLKSEGIKVDYVGIDIVPEFIEHSARKYPEQTFYCFDIGEKNLLGGRRFDYAVCSQVFNNKLLHEDNVEVASGVMRKLYGMVEKGFAIDFITSYVDFEEPRHYHYRPEQMFSIAKQLTKRVTLRHDYPLYEFCLYVYRDFKGWKTGK
jgi:2-polyprenyl-3-methyl-5-hydroxy-6-metoxy-1,4-benzoquinol methylase